MSTGRTEIAKVQCKGVYIHHMLLKHSPITGIFRSPYHLSVLVLLDFRAPPGTSTKRWINSPEQLFVSIINQQLIQTLLIFPCLFLYHA